MGTLDKEIRVIAIQGTKGDNGQDGKSSYELAVENELFSGTLEEWIETFSTPENYITRTEFQKVTQAQYDAMAQAGTLIPNCYYLIIDDTTAQDFATLQNTVGNLQTTVGQLQTDITNLGGRTYAHYCSWNIETTNYQGAVFFTIINHSSTPITPSNITVNNAIACSGLIIKGLSIQCPIIALRLNDNSVDYINENNAMANETITDVTSYYDNVY